MIPKDLPAPLPVSSLASREGTLPLDSKDVPKRRMGEGSAEPQLPPKRLRSGSVADDKASGSDVDPGLVQTLVAGIATSEASAIAAEVAKLSKQYAKCQDAIMAGILGAHSSVSPERMGLMMQGLVEGLGGGDISDSRFVDLLKAILSSPASAQSKGAMVEGLGRAVFEGAPDSDRDDREALITGIFNVHPTLDSVEMRQLLQALGRALGGSDISADSMLSVLIRFISAEDLAAEGNLDTLGEMLKGFGLALAPAAASPESKGDHKARVAVSAHEAPSTVVLGLFDAHAILSADRMREMIKSRVIQLGGTEISNYGRDKLLTGILGSGASPVKVGAMIEGLVDALGGDHIDSGDRSSLLNVIVASHRTLDGDRLRSAMQGLGLGLGGGDEGAIIRRDDLRAVLGALISVVSTADPDKLGMMMQGFGAALCDEQLQ